MSTRTYLDFDLQIDELDAATFRARVLNSPAGQAEATFEFPFSEQELEIFFLRIGRPRRGVRRIDSPEMNEARRFGSKLYQAVFQAALQACLLRSIDKAEQQGDGLRLRLRLPASLMDLPWEYLYDTALDRFYAHSTSTPIVRYLDLAQSIKPLAVTPPLKVLVMIASPRDYEALDVEGEWQKIEAAVADLQQRGLLQLTRLPAATLGALQRQLRREQYHIFHYIGHGGFDQQTQDGVLLLEDESGRSRRVNGNGLGTLLHDHPSLRLAVLNACEGARATRNDPFAGVAQQLVRQGIPAVIAMQFEITDKAAIILAQEFYDALVDGYPVDGALAEARKSIFTAENDIEWGTPVLYLRAVDGKLFDLADISVVVEPVKPIAQPVEKLADKLVIVDTQPLTSPASDPLKQSTTSDESTIIDTGGDTEQTTEQQPGASRIASQVIATKPANRFVTFSRRRLVWAMFVIALLVGLWFYTLRDFVSFRLGFSAATIPTVDASKWDSQPPSNPTIGSTWIDASKVITFVFVPAGKFTMGSNEYSNEKPIHTVNLDAFWIMQKEVTNAQYQKCVEANFCSEPSNELWQQTEFAQHPVVNIAWRDANDYTIWVGGRLPTEAEWEKAARGTEGYRYPWGNDEPNVQRLNFADSNIDKTTPVGNYPAGASPYSALDMAGNVWEWTADWYNSNYYYYSPPSNPPGPASGNYHVIRGGSWYGNADVVRSSVRFRLIDDRNSGVGFRVVRSVSPGR